MNFQAAFASALFESRHPRAGGDPGGGAQAPFDDVALHPAFAVYRNTVMKGCIDALEANFPAVARLVGSDWFRSAAAEYVRGHPPRDARMLVYGDEGFAEFVQALPSAAALPYLADVAHVDSLWRAGHVAADAPVLDADALAFYAPETLAERVLVPHPAARWAWFDGAPVASIWLRSRGLEPEDEELAWQGEGLLLTRPAGAVESQRVSRAACALLDACAQALPLGIAAEQALLAHRAVDLAALIAQLLRAAAFTEVILEN